MKIDGGVRRGVGEVKRQHANTPHKKPFPPPLSPNTPLRRKTEDEMKPSHPNPHMAASGLRSTRVLGCVTGCFSPIHSAPRCAHLFGRARQTGPLFRSTPLLHVPTLPQPTRVPGLRTTPVLPTTHHPAIRFSLFSSSPHFSSTPRLRTFRTTTASHIPRPRRRAIVFIIHSFR